MAKTLAIIVGVVLVLVGILGFVPNPLVGTTALFVTNSALDIAYIILGLILLIVAFWMAAQSALWLKIIGIVYLILGVIGFFMVPVLAVFAVNMATNWLHVVIGVVLLIIGFTTKGSKSMMPPMNTPPTGAAM